MSNLDITATTWAVVQKMGASLRETSEGGLLLTLADGGEIPMSDSRELNSFMTALVGSDQTAAPILKPAPHSLYTDNPVKMRRRDPRNGKRWNGTSPPPVPPASERRAETLPVERSNYNETRRKNEAYFEQPERAETRKQKLDNDSARAAEMAKAIAHESEMVVTRDYDPSVMESGLRARLAAMALDPNVSLDELTGLMAELSR